MTKRGRPTKEPTSEERSTVLELLAKDAPLAHIAKLLGYSLPTLRKYFQPEIFSGKKIKEPERPVRKVTAEQREQVKRYVGTRIKPEKVALLFGYTTPADFEEFKETFALELMIADVAIRAQIVDRLHEQSKGGMVGATNKLEALSRPTTAPAATPAEHIGKKDAALRRAADVSDQLRPIGPPTLKAVK